VADEPTCAGSTSGGLLAKSIPREISWRQSVPLIDDVRNRPAAPLLRDDYKTLIRLLQQLTEG